jgi:lipoyl(octanoyl) transferase
LLTDGISVAMLGLRGYEQMRTAQEQLVDRRRRGEIGDALLILEHPPTYTRGRRTEPEDLHHEPDWYRERGIEVFNTPRGGRVTYHGPGQLVVYPIVDLHKIGEQPDRLGRADVAGFVAALETAMIRTAARWQVPAGAINGLTGIWTGDGDPIPDRTDAKAMAGAVASGVVRKIGSIGLRISRGITSHGLSLNVSCDLEPFGGITSCGIDHCRISSILAETGASPPVGTVGLALSEELGPLLGRNPVIVAPEELGLIAGLTPRA